MSGYRTHTAAEAGLLVNSYLVEAADDLVLVDANLPVSAAADVADTIARIAEAKRAQWQPVYGDEWPDRHRVPARAPTRTDGQRAELTAAMTRFLPGAPLTWMIGLGADAVAAELAGEAVAA